VKNDVDNDYTKQMLFLYDDEEFRFR
jgi:hypothetical protein